jgi:hypothetical protein
MPFEIKKVLDHGTTNPIVARLSLQILEILKQCKASQDIQNKIGELYINSLLKKLLRCWEIEERFKKEFASGASIWMPSGPPAGCLRSVVGRGPDFPAVDEARKVLGE